MTVDPYVFRSERLGFRNWRENDLQILHKINSYPEVMRYFPAIPGLEETEQLLTRMKLMFEERKYCYFAVDHLKNKELIGFIGLSEQTFESPYTPCVDIGWRLHPEYWHKGLATEGALRCLEYGFKEIGLQEICSIAPLENKPSIAVMKKIGMELAGIFNHPKLAEHAWLKPCACYQLTKDKFPGQNKA